MACNETPLLKGTTMTNPADQLIVDLIESLIDDHRNCFSSEIEQRQQIINQIAQLRASMEPVIHVTEKD